jgi:hypothetical protein
VPYTPDLLWSLVELMNLMRFSLKLSPASPTHGGMKRGLVSPGETAGPSTTLRFGRDDNSVAEWALSGEILDLKRQEIRGSVVEGPAVSFGSKAFCFLSESRIRGSGLSISQQNPGISLVFREMWGTRTSIGSLWRAENCRVFRLQVASPITVPGSHFFSCRPNQHRSQSAYIQIWKQSQIAPSGLACISHHSCRSVNERVFFPRVQRGCGPAAEV